MFWSTVGRMIVVPIAFLFACMTALFVLFSLGSERVVRAMSGQSDLDGIGTAIELLGQGWLLASGLTILPALALVIVGEVARIRAALYYVLGGGAALIAVPLLARIGQTSAAAIPNAAIWQVFATAGFAGGFIYWLLAGRRA